jgi:guanine deaminase
MCLGAIYWARPTAFYYAASREDAALAGFDDDHIYREFALSPATRSIPGHPLLAEAGREPLTSWSAAEKKIRY